MKIRTNTIAVLAAVIGAGLFANSAFSAQIDQTAGREDSSHRAGVQRPQVVKYVTGRVDQTGTMPKGVYHHSGRSMTNGRTG